MTKLPLPAGSKGSPFPCSLPGSPCTRYNVGLQHGARVSKKGVERSTDPLRQGVEVIATLGKELSGEDAEKRINIGVHTMSSNKKCRD